MNLNKQMIKVAIAALVLLGAIDAGFTLAKEAEDQPLTPQDKPKITEQQAIKTVLEANPGTTVKTTELEKENAVLVYEVELDNKLEVMVDANSGQIVGTEQE